MTATVRSRPPPTVEGRWWARCRPVERVAIAIGLVLLASGLLHGAGLLVSGGSWKGPLSFRKAASFGVSFGLTLLTVTWATSSLAMANAARKTLLGAFTAACVLEAFLVTMQAWRRVPSHFNTETSFDATVAMTLAFGGAVIIVCVLGFTVAALRTSQSPAMTVALRFGFVTLALSMAVGAVMIAHGVSLSRGGDYARAYASGGSLKPLHAVTLHAILVVPGLAWLLGRTSWSETACVRAVWGAAAAYTAVIVSVAAALVR